MTAQSVLRRGRASRAALEQPRRTIRTVRQFTSTIAANIRRSLEVLGILSIALQVRARGRKRPVDVFLRPTGAERRPRGQGVPHPDGASRPVAGLLKDWAECLGPLSSGYREQRLIDVNLPWDSKRPSGRPEKTSGEPGRRERVIGCAKSREAQEVYEGVRETGSAEGRQGDQSRTSSTGQ